MIAIAYNPYMAIHNPTDKTPKYSVTIPQMRNMRKWGINVKWILLPEKKEDDPGLGGVCIVTVNSTMVSVW